MTTLTAASPVAQRSAPAPVHLRYLGTAGWQIDDGKTVVLIDPYLSRLRRFNVTYDVSQDAAIQRLQSFLAEVATASPKTKVIVPEYFEPITIP